ncbi:MAG: acyl-CoA thioesterase [Phycisphaerales bacterium]|nr:acyl-CoA thioesterase [Phycisphaerales bacterium]
MTTEEHLALRVHMMPRHANWLGTVFGGTILSLIDQAGFHEATEHGRHRWVTASMDAVDFSAPVYIGDMVTLYTRTVSSGTSSVTVGVRVVASRVQTGEDVEVTTAQLTMVSVDPSGKPLPFSTPPTAGYDASHG